MLPCLILAGGLGTRMRPDTEKLPKAMLPVLGRPFVDWQLDLLGAQGVREVVLSIGHLGDLLIAHVGDGAARGLRVRYADEGSALRGTGGAIRLAIDSGLLHEPFLVINGDSYLPIDIAGVVDSWRRSGLPALMTVYRNEGRFDSSNAVVAEDRVVVYDKSRPAAWVERMAWIDYGLCVLTPEVVVARVPPDTVADIAAVMRDLSLSGLLAAHEVDERFYEVGSPAGLRDLEDHLSRTAGRISSR